MKKLFLIFTIITGLLVPTIILGADTVKFGVIDLQRCLKESKEGEKVFGILKKKKEDLQAKLDEKQKALIELRRELEKQAMMLSMDAQEDKRKTIERKARELEYYFKDLNEEMLRAQEKEKKRIFDELKVIIDKIGSEEGFTLILEKRAGGVLYSNDSVEITEQVIKLYDQTKEKGKK